MKTFNLTMKFSKIDPIKSYCKKLTKNYIYIYIYIYSKVNKELYKGMYNLILTRIYIHLD